MAQNPDQAIADYNKKNGTAYGTGPGSTVDGKVGSPAQATPGAPGTAGTGGTTLTTQAMTPEEVAGYNKSWQIPQKGLSTFMRQGLSDAGAVKGEKNRSEWMDSTGLIHHRIEGPNGNFGEATYRPGSVAQSASPVPVAGSNGSLSVAPANGILNGVNEAAAGANPAGGAAPVKSAPQMGLVESNHNPTAPATQGSPGVNTASSGPKPPDSGYQWKLPSALTGATHDLRNPSSGKHTLMTDAGNLVRGEASTIAAGAQDAGHIAAVAGRWGLHNILQPMGNYVFGTNWGQNQTQPAPVAPVAPVPSAVITPPTEQNPQGTMVTPNMPVVPPQTVTPQVFLPEGFKLNSPLMNGLYR
jgi:hypothetical protein